MRTTVNIDDDVLAAARALAGRNGTSLDRALSELARRGLEGVVRGEQRRRGASFAVEPGVYPITSEDVYRSLDDWP